jgi:hypothetical protein
MAGVKDIVPVKQDPFEDAIQAVHLGTRFFGATGANRPSAHNGMDLFVPIGTPLQMPAERMVLIGVTRHGSKPGESMGNALLFFVPDKQQPYFLALLHLDRRTFKVLNEKHLGTELLSEPGVSRVVAYTGNSPAVAYPHLHVTASTRFQIGGNLWSARDFMEIYEAKTISPAFLKSLNPDVKSGVASIMPPAARGIRGRKGLLAAGYLDPEPLIGKSLRFSTQPPMRLPNKETAKTSERLAPLR